MYPTLITIGNVSIPTYTVLLDLGLILGLVITYFEGKRKLGSAEIALDLGLWTVIGGIIGGRIGYVLANLGVYSEDWAQVVQIWKGGLSFHGAFLGGLLVLGIFALVQRRREHPASFWQLADVVVPGLALGVLFGWAACLMGGCSYGVLGRGFGTLILPDVYGVEAARFATQLFGLAQAGVLFIVFWFLRDRWPFAGAAFLMYCLLYFGGQFFLEFLRGDEAIYLGPFRVAQVLDLAIALLAAIGLMVLWWRERSRGEEPEEVEEAEGLQVDASEGVEETGPAEGAEEVGAAEGAEEISLAEGAEEAAAAQAGEGPAPLESDGLGPEEE
jgi:phosphatidylglycerol:prolipoprotein diacylglycerol transferase